MVKLALNNTEAGILTAIRTLGFGELYNLGRIRLNERPNKVYQLDPAEYNLIKLLRERSLNKVVVHQGKPKSAEFPEVINDIDCLKKVRF